MNKFIVMTLGVLLSAMAVSAFAAQDDRENLAQCKADINAYYGDETRTRLRSIRQRSGEAELRLMVTTKGSSNTLVVCRVTSEGISRLENGDGVALVPTGKAPVVSLVE
jgi:hypothetical protein